MASRKGAATSVASAAVAATAAAGAVALERRARSRRKLAALDPALGFDASPDEVLSIRAADGVELHVEIDHPKPVSGKGKKAKSDAPTVVLAHGFTLNLDSWVFQRRALTKAGYRVVLWDQRSHGASGRSDDEHATIEQLGHDLFSVISAAAPTGDLVLVGHSMGGMTIMALAHHYPDLVRERVIAAAFVATSSGGGGLTSLNLGPIVGHVVGRVGPSVLNRLGRLAGPITQLRRLGRNVEDVLVEHYSYASPVSQKLVRFSADMIFATPFETMGEFLSALDSLDEAEALATFHGIETLVVNGEGDQLTPPSHSDAIVEAIPGAEHVVVADAGHLIQLEHPQLINEELLALIERGLRARHPDVSPTQRPRVRKVITDVAKERRVSKARERAS